eukprot:771010_1
MDAVSAFWLQHLSGAITRQCLQECNIILSIYLSIIRIHTIKYDAVIDLKEEYQIFSSQGVLFLDHDETNINQVKDECTTYHIPKVWCNMRGPTFDDFALIESIIGTQT